jgi:hypothetical protein
MRTAGHITGVTVHMVTASPLTATGTPTLATAIPVATATATETKGIATAAATKGTTATTKGIATAAATKGTAMAETEGTATAATKGTAMAETEGTATAITGYRKSDRYRGDAANKWRLVQKLGLFEFARVLVRFDHVARCIVTATHSIMRTARKTFALCYRNVNNAFPRASVGILAG